jgi:signal transduction histidine kinase
MVVWGFEIGDRHLRFRRFCIKIIIKGIQKSEITDCDTGGCGMWVNNNWVQIAIKDNGMGINPEIKQRIFDPFFTTKPVGEGTGLGLSISYQIIVDKHSGKLDCISAPEKGTEFIIEIPIKLHQP